VRRHGLGPFLHAERHDWTIAQAQAGQQHRANKLDSFIWRYSLAKQPCLIAVTSAVASI
jgi:hypothetical protein